MRKLTVLLGIALAIEAWTPLPAAANKVHAHTVVWYYLIPHGWCDKTSGDANRDYAICQTSYKSGWAYAKEGWLFTGNQYVLDNYANSYAPKHYSATAHAHHHVTSPAPPSSHDIPPPPVPAAGSLSSFAYTHVNYRESAPNQLTIDLVPETIVQVAIDASSGQSTAASLTLTIDGVPSKVEIVGRMQGGQPVVDSTRTGLFGTVPYSITPYPNQVYALTFNAPLQFTVNASLASDLNLESFSGDSLHDRPKTASSFYLNFTRAFDPCATTPLTHDAPWNAHMACPPTTSSPVLSFGPKGLGTMKGTVRLDAAKCATDVVLVGRFLDVRNGDDGTGTPFSGNLTIVLPIRMTDNLCPTPSSCTVVDLPFPIPMSCADGKCDAATSFNTLVPGSVVPCGQVNMEIGHAAGYLGSAHVFDGGLYAP